MKIRLTSLVLVIVMLLASLATCAGAAPAETFTTAAASPFTDVSTNDWFYETVMYAYENGLVNGTSDTTFNPSGSMTRAMFVTVLGRMVGVDQSKYIGIDYSDVKSGQYYTSYVKWATESGLVSGYGNGLFGTEDVISREQMATIIARFVEIMDLTLDDVENPVSSFKDASKVSSWAKDGVELMRKTGIVTGDTNANFNPQNPATRAEAATILVRLKQRTEVPEAPKGGGTDIWDGVSITEPDVVIDDTYYIYTGAELAWVASMVNGGNSFSGYTVKLMNNIDLANKSWTPIGNSSKSFAGVFEGSGLAILNLKIDSTSSHAGLFGYTGTAIIQNLSVRGVSLTGGKYAGALIGYNKGGTLKDCSATGDIKITGDSYVGGLVGYNTGTISGYTVTGNITITAVESSGGLVGRNDSGGTIQSCAIGGDVYIKSSGTYAGGLVGCSYGAVTGCVITGTAFVSGASRVGGLIGICYSSATVQNCEIGGDITIDSSNGIAGGLFGSNSGTVTGCSAGGGVDITNGGSESGGLAGNSSGAMTGCTIHEGVTISGKGTVGGMTGYASGSLKDCAIGGSVNISGGGTKVGGVIGSGGATVTGCEISGSVTLSGSTYIGGMAGDINGTLKNCVVGGNVAITGSDGHIGGIAGSSSATIAECTVKGRVSLTGGGYVGGLIGGTNGMMSGCSVGAVDIISSGYYTGGLIGYSTGTVTGCVVNGSASVIGKSDIGAFIGRSNSSTLTGCTIYGSASVAGSSKVGAVYGSKDGTEPFGNTVTGTTTVNGEVQ